MPAFSLALTGLLPPGAPADEAAELLPEMFAGRQAIAAGGKDLPVGAIEGDGEADTESEAGTDEEAAAPFAWFAVPLPAPLAMATPPGPALAERTVAEPLPGSPVVATEVVPAEGAPPTEAGAVELPPVADAAPAERPAAPILLPQGARPAPRAAAPAAAPIEIPVQAAAPSRDALPVREVAPERPVAIQQPPVRPLPSPQVAAVAAPFAVTPPMFDALAPAAPRRVAQREAAVMTAAALAAEATRAPQVAATPDTRQPAIDMRRQEWLGAMVERIEMLRDAAGPARETNIRLAPDALGSVEVSIRQEGDRVHVRFSAENAAARTLLTEAQPRLAELAEARGLRLAGSSVDAGTAGQGGQRHEAAPELRQQPRPASAEAAAQTDSDDRIA